MQELCLKNFTWMIQDLYFVIPNECQKSYCRCAVFYTVQGNYHFNLNRQIFQKHAIL